MHHVLNIILFLNEISISISDPYQMFGPTSSRLASSGMSPIPISLLSIYHKLFFCL